MSKGIRTANLFILIVAATLFLIGGTAVYGLDEQTEKVPSDNGKAIAEVQNHDGQPEERK